MIERHLLHQPVSHPHHRAPLDLSLDALGVDRLAHVVAGHVAQHPDPAGLGVDLDLDGMGAKGEVGEHPAAAAAEVDRIARGRMVDGQRAPGDAEPGALPHDRRQGGAPAVSGHHRILAHPEVGRRRLEHLRGHREHLLAKARARLEHRVARHVQLAGGRRRAREGRERAVGDVNRDAGGVEAQHFGGDLAERRRLAPADVRGARADDQAPVHLEPDPGARPVVEPRDAAVRLDVAGQAAPHAARGG